jgi:hypothetical protein
VEDISNSNSEINNLGVDVNTRLPHSGKLGLEKPVTDFSTPLERAHNEGLIDELPDSIPDSLDEPVRSVRSMAKKIGVIVTSAAVLTGGAVLFSRNSTSSKVPRTKSQPAIEQSKNQQKATEAAEESVTSTSVTIKSEPTINESANGTANEFDTNIHSFAKEHGLFDITTILPGESTISVEKNGNSFLVPAQLRDPAKDPRAFAESAVALWACYLTTGNDSCLNAFTDSDEIKSLLKEQRESDYVTYQSHPGNETAYAGFIDKTDSPAVWQADNSYVPNKVSLSGGTLMYERIDYDPYWQYRAQRQTKLDLQTTILEFGIYYPMGTNNSPRITSIHWETKDI